MNELPMKEPSLVRRWWNRLFRGWVGELSDEMAACELKCRELDCDLSRWEQCEKRLQFMADIKEHRQKVAQADSFRDTADSFRDTVDHRAN